MAVFLWRWNALGTRESWRADLFIGGKDTRMTSRLILLARAHTSGTSGTIQTFYFPTLPLMCSMVSFCIAFSFFCGVLPLNWDISHLIDLLWAGLHFISLDHCSLGQHNRPSSRHLATIFLKCFTSCGRSTSQLGPLEWGHFSSSTFQPVLSCSRHLSQSSELLCSNFTSISFAIRSPCTA